MAGVVIALLSAVPSRRLTREERAEANRHADATILGRARQRASRSIDAVFRRDAPMAKALLIADQHEISPEMRDRYARAGIIHMLSISGLHVAIIAGAMLLLLRLARLPPSIASLGSILVIAIYVAVIGAPPPALRSAAMLAMATISRVWQRPTSPWAAWAAGAFVPLVVPRTVLDLGYQLSVAGIAGLIASGVLARRFLTPRFSGLRLKIGRDLLTSIIASVVSAPLVTWYFGRMSLIAPLSNLAAGPVISLLQPTLFLALVFARFPTIAGLFAAAAHPLLIAFDRIASTAAGIPGSSLNVAPTFVVVIAASVAVIALLVASLSRYPGKPLVAGAAALAVVAWAPAVRLPYHGGVELHVLDVGQGDAILLRTNKGHWILVDAGRIWETGDAGRSTIIPYVLRRGGSLETFILSHAHADHVGGAASVFHALHPKTFWDAAFAQGSRVYDNSLRVARDEKVEWRRVHPGDAIELDGVGIDFLAPDSVWTASLTDPNLASTIALVRYGSVRFLLVGDAEAPEENWLLEHARSELHADVLKVGHHGSSTSSTDEFLAAVHPAAAIISVGADNPYGHPSADVLASLGRVGARVVRTDKLGTIIVRTDGHAITLEAEGQRWDISAASRD
ncbi:MAG: DNA internalization-related competence protein ComEC/Rec2 [Gemmatimonadaceae bacterium]